MSDDVHEVYAIRYGHHKRPSSANFIHGDPHDMLQPLDYFVWAIVGPSGTIVVDTGFDEATARKRGREMIRPVRDGLLALGIAPELDQGCHHQPPALRSLRELRSVSAGLLSPARP